MRKIKSILDKGLSAVCAALLAFMTILTIYQVVMRYVFHSPSTMSEDILSYSFVWVSLLGTAMVFGQKDHMRLSFFSDKIKGKGQLVLSIFSELLISAVAITVFLVGGKAVMGVGVLQTSPTLGIHMDWIYIILPISGVLIIVYSFIHIIQSIQKFNMGGKGELQ
ncbi:MAG: TRAP transporter small permease [Shouchella clausii]|jgi:TRAP-type C4-dicarboxylate transport system permease small subunit|uniref:TRAP transporter small permease n=1 Tax=Shouchella clausii TaxID=79880 RepID=UPI000BA7BF38|nr:TRAP transporter small permease [Shouchella clausii]PAF15608.1 C4-dicarboxylate ABC transporter permease [Shouchella clausii]